MPGFFFNSTGTSISPFLRNDDKSSLTIKLEFEKSFNLLTLAGYRVRVSESLLVRIRSLKKEGGVIGIFVILENEAAFGENERELDVFEREYGENEREIGKNEKIGK